MANAMVSHCQQRQAVAALVSPWCIFFRILHPTVQLGPSACVLEALELCLGTKDDSGWKGLSGGKAHFV